jgi:hypothetical protein
MPYTSYFSDGQSASAQWGLSLNHAKTVCEIWDLVRTELNDTYRPGPAAKEYVNAHVNDAKGYFTQKASVYDVPDTMSSYKSTDVEITEAQFKKLVDIQRALLILRAFYTGGQSVKARVNYKMIWSPVKGRMGGDENEAENVAKKFNGTYCPDELRHYLHYLVKSKKEPSKSIKPWVVEHNGKIKLRVWYRKAA